MSAKAWAVTTTLDGHNEVHTVFGLSRGKVAYDVLLTIGDFYPGLSFKDIKVRSLGIRDTPEEIAERKVTEFNQKFPVGTPVKVYPGAMGDHNSAYDTIIKAPGAEVKYYHKGCDPAIWVRIPGDRIALSHVIPLVPMERKRA